MQRLTSISSFITEDVFGWIVFLIGALLAFVAPINNLLLFTGFAIVLDVFTGVWASRSRGETFNSKKLSRSWAKMVLYPGGIIFSFWAEKLAPEIPFVKGATYLLIAIEGKSLEENFSDILGFSMMKYIRVFITRGRKGLLEELNNKEK